MTSTPLVSVVMGVYNGAAKLRETVDSILGQEGVDLEFVIVDDGSTDFTPAMLDELERQDARVRWIRQENLGLTRALVRGCAEARGELIARQDCGDRSLPGRLLAQVRAMRQHPDAALVSCGTRFVGPEDEPLYEVAPDEREAAGGLKTLDWVALRGPSHHGSALFRRDLYLQVGGYRDAFYFAQDLDLWMRMVERGRHVALAQVLYQAGFSLDSISGLQRPAQLEAARIIIECARARRAGKSEAPLLSLATGIRSDRNAAPGNLAPSMYFVGMCLQQRGDARARHYFRKALRENPMHLKSALRLLLGWCA